MVTTLGNGGTTKVSSPLRTRRLALVCAAAIFIVCVLTSLVIVWYSDAQALLSHHFTAFKNDTAEPSEFEVRERARRTPGQWLTYMRRNAGENGTQTVRLGCREYVAGAQSCTYEGFVCVNTSKKMDFGKPQVYFLDETETDGDDVPSDNWCGYRHQSADPRYYASRHWPIWEDTFAPQTSCLEAFYRTERSLVGKSLKGDATGKDAKIKWVPSMWLVDLDYVDNNHNNHLLMDIIWMLDVTLWQESVDLQSPPGLSDVQGQTAGDLFSNDHRHVYLPQGEKDFIQQTSRDINRLLYALVLQLDLPRLYPNQTRREIRIPPEAGLSRYTAKLLDAYPKLKTDEQLLFHRNLRSDDDVDLVCTPRFTAGAKIHNGAHERVCRAMRQRSYELFGIKEPEMQHVGQAYFPQPPKRIVILQRHITRGISNADALAEALKTEFVKYAVEVEIVATEQVKSAEEHVRVFANAGVVITSHGSQSMGQIWMPRHRYVPCLLILSLPGVTCVFFAFYGFRRV